MSGSLSFILDRPIIYMTVKYIDQSDNISWCIPGLQPGFEPTINHKPGEHANHYTIDASIESLQIHLNKLMKNNNNKKQTKADNSLNL